MRSVYFDNAATTQIREEVLDRMVEVMRDVSGNPSSTHALGRTAKSHIESARKTIAKILNVTAGEIIFTSGGTEADNFVINSAVRDLGVQRIITSRIEHHAVLHAVEEVAASHKIDIDFVSLKECGTPDEKHLQELLQSTTKKTLVSLMHVNNEIGNMIDIKSIAVLSKSHGALVHSDMVQSIGHYKVDLQEIPVDFVAAAGHKFHGPKGVGFAFVRKNSGLKPLIFGGSQERGLRAGTESVHNIAGIEEAIRCAYDNLDEERSYIKGIKNYFIEKLASEIPAAKLNGNCSDSSKSTYTLLNVCLPINPEKALMLLFQLDMKGIACSKGSACQSGSDKGSHVLQEILTDEDLEKPSVRFSFSKYNTREEVDYTVSVLKEFLEKIPA
ncbi:cysteine desulfurase family protein [Dokdonia sp. Hel_I_53]|uniref:cysteine desulfurase family protein n=1 Tax=Dokdonia sp. Hel_I_53 TaxID=1566287 RepID=UPI0011997184|nr:cysteine desulfurase family protein [Dokdonia sp. Hel_I_53]TVZ51825.1 cysteine desulfurase [Dokdonia sp. Hel_I_53]